MYPYGDTYDGKTCNGHDVSLGLTAEVGSHPGCQSQQAGFTGVFHLSGNAVEWEDSCKGNGSDDVCRLRGGAMYDIVNDLRCDFASATARSSYNDYIGFRCCAP